MDAQGKPLFFGLLNGGATCWLNATYQALISIEPFMKYLRDHTTKLEPAQIAAADAINGKLMNKFFGHTAQKSDDVSEIVAMGIEFAKICAIIDPLTSPDTFYSCESLKKYASAPSVHFPLAICALNESIRFSQSPRYLQESALRLFGALVIYCATTGARPYPEYRATGEVGFAMFETIIGALEFEGLKNIRALFNVGVKSRSLCFDHTAQYAIETPTTGVESLDQLCLHVVPPSSTAVEHASLAYEIFTSSVQTSVDVTDKPCSICKIPTIMSIENHEKFGPVIAIITDDIVARGLVKGAATTSVYRRSPVGQIYVPYEFTILNKVSESTFDFVTYRISSQILQEGGHFTAIVARTNRNITSYAYISDTGVSIIPNMKVSPGMAMLFYTAVNKSGIIIDERTAMQIFGRTTYRSIQGFNALNRNNAVTPSVGLAPQELANSAHVGLLKFNVADFGNIIRDFYYIALNSQVMLEMRTTLAQSGLDIFYDNKVGIGFALAIVLALWKQTQNGGRAKFTPSHFAAWKLWISPQMLQILAMDCADKLRRELRDRIASSTSPLTGLTNDPSVLNLPSTIRPIVSKLILAAYAGEDVANIAGNDFAVVMNKPKIGPTVRANAAIAMAPAQPQIQQSALVAQPVPVPAPVAQSAPIVTQPAPVAQPICDAIFPRRITAPHLVNSASDQLAPYSSSSLILSHARRIR